MMNVRNVALFSSWCLLGAVYIWQPNFSVLFIWTCITMAYVFAFYVRYGIMRTVRLMRSEAKLPNTSLEIRLKMRHKLWFDSVLHSNFTVKEYWKTSTGEKIVCVFKCKFGTSMFDFTYDFRHFSRGIYTYDYTEWIGADVFGLFYNKKQKRMREDASSLVIPPAQLDAAAHLEIKQKIRMQHVFHSAVTEHDDSETMREYRPGDPKKQIHWKASAKLGELLIRESMQSGPIRDVYIWIDCYHPSAEQFEQLLSYTASLVETLHDKKVQLAVPSTALALHSTSKNQLSYIMAGLNRVDEGTFSSWLLEQVAVRNLSSCMSIIVTTKLDGSLYFSLKQISKISISFLIYWIVDHEHKNEEQMKMLQAIHALGITVVTGLFKGKEAEVRDAI